jgi:hypothetical protein
VIRRGDKVYFGRRRGEQTLGEVVKVSPKSYRVRQLEARGSTIAHGVGSMWNVARHLVRLAEAGAEPRPARASTTPRSPGRQRGQIRVINGVDIDQAVVEFRKLPVFRDHPIPSPLRVDVSIAAHRPTHYRGTAFYKSGRIRIMSGRETPPARILEVLLHELTHMALPGHGHDELFRKTFARAVREAWVLEIPIDLYGYKTTQRAPRARPEPLRGVELPARGHRVRHPDAPRPGEHIRLPTVQQYEAALEAGRPSKPKPKPRPKPKPKPKPKLKPKPQRRRRSLNADELVAEALGKLK